jgi:dCTP diphosphatase
VNDDSNTTVAALRRLVARFVEERDWAQFHDPKNLAMSIAIETAELMEHFQWLRSDQMEEITSDPKAMAQVREELADVLAFAVAFANTLNIDITKAMTDKFEKNAKKYPAEKFRGRFK